jgi:hypothetical protein
MTSETKRLERAIQALKDAQAEYVEREVPHNRRS